MGPESMRYGAVGEQARQRPPGAGNAGSRKTAVLSSPVTVWLLVVAGVLWVVTVVRSQDMGNMPGTMDMGLVGFVVMWTLMMAAMMLPSMAPFAVLYSRSMRVGRWFRVSTFAGGYLTAWAATGVAAYGLAWAGGSVAGDFPDAARVVAAGVFVLVGAYQLTPAKLKCLKHCRSPIGHVMHFGQYRGPSRDVRAGLVHGLFCLGCCWALMVLMVAFGVMNVWTMVALAALIGVEKVWRHGELAAKGAGLGCLVLGVVVLFVPSIAPGLDPDRIMNMPGTEMSGTGMSEVEMTIIEGER